MPDTAVQPPAPPQQPPPPKPPDIGGFDVEGARNSGYSDDEILQHLTSTRKFDIDSALKAGYSKPEIIQHLTTTPPPVGPKPPGFFQDVREGMAGFGAGAISTGVGAYNLARKIPGIGKVLPPPSPFVQSLTQPPPTPAGQIGKTAEQIGEFFVPGGAVGKGTKALEAATEGVRGAKALRLLGRAGMESANAAGVTALQTGGDPEATKNAALIGGGASVALPLATKAIGKVVPAVLGKTTGAGETAIRTAATQPSVDFMNAMRGGVSEGQIVNEFKTALGNVKDARGAAYQQQLAQISKQGGPPLDITPVRQQLASKLQQFRVGTTADGGLDFTQSTIPKGEEAIVKNIADDVNSWTDTSPLGVDALKRRIGNYYSPTSDVRALTSSVQNATKQVLTNNVPGYLKMTKDYAMASDFINKVENEMSLGPTAQEGTSIRKISYALKQNNEYRKVLTDALNQWTSSDLKGMLAGYHLKDMLPKGLTGVGSGVGILGAIATGHLTPAAGVALMASSPRLVGETLAAMARLRPFVASVAVSTPIARTALESEAAATPIPKSRQLPAPNTPYGVSGVTVPDILGASTKGTGSPVPLLNAPEELAPNQMPGPNVRQMPGVPDTSGMTVTTGPPIQNPARQLGAAPIQMPAVQDPSGIQLVAPAGRQVGRDPATGRGFRYYTSQPSFPREKLPEFAEKNNMTLEEATKALEDEGWQLTGRNPRAETPPAPVKAPISIEAPASNMPLVRQSPHGIVRPPGVPEPVPVERDPRYQINRLRPGDPLHDIAGRVAGRPSR